MQENAPDREGREDATGEEGYIEVVPEEGGKGGPVDEAEEEQDLAELMWDLDTETRIKNLTWWWWWWIFFIRNPEEPSRPRQLMILWSTKNCDRIKVDDYLWERNQDIVKTGKPGRDEEGRYRRRRMNFDGMTAVWWFDGEQMHDPYALERSDFTVEWRGDTGYVRPHTDNVYLYSGQPGEYRVLIRRDGDEFDLRMTPWNDFMSRHRFREGHYLGRMGYKIYKIYGSRLGGHIRTGGLDEDIEGSAYFQKVTVNAPAVPWYWGLFHAEDGSFLDYFNPHFGLPVWRKRADPESFWDRGAFSLSRQLQFYDATTGGHYEFEKGQLRFSKEIVDGLPIFQVEGDNGEQSLHLKVRAYSRAYWRFEQRYLGFMRSVLYYNEYPAEMLEFDIRGGERDLTREDLGYVAGNIEHSWGWLV